MSHRDADPPAVEPLLGAAVLLLAAAWSVRDGHSVAVVSVTVSVPAVLDSVDATVVVTIFEVLVTTIDVVVRVSAGRDAVSPRIAVKLADAAKISDLADEPNEAYFELAFKITAPADSVAAAAAELARATRLLASDAASDTLLATSEPASLSALRISDALAETAADTEAALVKISDSALVGKGTGRMVTAGDSDLMATLTANHFDFRLAIVNLASSWGTAVPHLKLLKLTFLARPTPRWLQTARRW